jgi:hypothetical protein
LPLQFFGLHTSLEDRDKILSGCGHHNVKKYGSLVPEEKTITVPPGSSGVKGGIKNVLSERGWKMMVDKDETISILYKKSCRPKRIRSLQWLFKLEGK